MTALGITLTSLAFVVNVAVAGGVGAACLRGTAGMDAAYGADGSARRILASIYLAIAGVSAVGLAALLVRPEVGLAIAWPLFSLQLVYKLLTALTVGPANPVVRANLAICALLVIALLATAL